MRIGLNPAGCRSAFLSAAGIIWFRSAGRRHRPRSRSDRRFAWRTGERSRRALAAARKFDLLLQPRLIISRSIDDQTPLHRIVTQPAKLAADHFEGSGFDRL